MLNVQFSRERERTRILQDWRGLLRREGTAEFRTRNFEG
jgi:hypothetical protein